ncbi:HlyD family efflux transporter periplasmic adaptor subunit [Flavihumibacter sp. ZG627]|uniref:HlyD family efflux transporter periplasmic adaptor subunit n=1 Tax=Flavihumibacter sp. ZG627 TaxID=1463156 RepID=UPI000580160C|nr:HlyD family efflux transporter periplasmic adaptor subunit [Flavihumibacter sp. ZG627]KIC90445.1 hypothetical protein HY58_10830 [Flavihumibacter sp. ZG627]
MANKVFEQQRILAGRLPGSVRILYLVSIFLVLILIGSGRFLKMDVVVKSHGQIRPALERTMVRSGISGLIDSLYVKEGQRVQKGAVLALLNGEHESIIESQFSEELKRKRKLLEDLEQLTLIRQPYLSNSVVINSDAYRQQLKGFQQVYQEKNLLLQYAKNEEATASALLEDKIIARSEYELKLKELRQAEYNARSYWHQQLSRWSEEKQKLNQDMHELDSRSRQINAEKKKLMITAPVGGIIMGVNSRYEGNTIQAGETFCSVSPEDTLIAECYVNTEDVGFLYDLQPVSFRVDAYDHKTFGTVSGRVLKIDDDQTIMDNRSVFRIRCSISQLELSSNNGFKARLKKGLGLEARFIITRRTLWQLLFDKLENWLDPVTAI